MLRSKLPLRILLASTCLLLLPGCRTRQQKEQQLEEALNSMNQAIDRFSDDKDRYPKSLQELVDAGYLKKIPTDPVTGSSKTWLCLADEDDSGETGIADISSGSESPESDEGTYTKCP